MHNRRGLVDGHMAKVVRALRISGIRPGGICPLFALHCEGLSEILCLRGIVVQLSLSCLQLNSHRKRVFGTLGVHVYLAELLARGQHSTGCSHLEL